MRKAPASLHRGLHENWGGDLLSHPVSRAVPSALEGLTSLFGMGRGVAPPQVPPQTGQPPKHETLVHTKRTSHITRPSLTAD